MTDLRQDLLRSIAQHGIPLTLVQPEPEVTVATLASVRCRSLARIVAELVNENEPLLCAEVDGETVVVRERGTGAAMRFTVQNGERA
ncbi:MAG TPA: hypothetical protein VFJ46_17680 [Xanthobacteraceae bacterium]|nr:hypothetical protein [Xanthobacteraceae bacterium]